jgi:hypothetical protein
VSTRHLSRRMWHLTEPYHAATYFASECRDAFTAVGLRGFWMGYFAGRSAPLGRVPPEVVIATFFNFHPARVRRALPDAWGFATVEQVLAARIEGVDGAMRRLLGDHVGDPALAEAGDLARAATEGCELPGRPLFAGNAALPWPDEPHLVLWHATTLLREHRGDGHVTALASEGLDGCEVHVLASAASGATPEMLQVARGWSPEDWAAASQRLRERGWFDARGELTALGRQTRERIEDRTDDLALPPWRHLGAARCERLAGLLTEPVRRILDSGALPFPNPIGLPVPPG